MSSNEQGKINEISDKITQIIKDINISLSNNREKIIICYADHCEFCQEYLDEIQAYYCQNKLPEDIMEVKLFDVGNNMNEKIWAKFYEVKNLPCTLFMNKDNVIKGKIDGIIEGKDIKVIANTIYGK